MKIPRWPTKLWKKLREIGTEKATAWLFEKVSAWFIAHKILGGVGLLIFVSAPFVGHSGTRESVRMVNPSLITTKAIILLCLLMTSGGGFIIHCLYRLHKRSTDTDENRKERLRRAASRTDSQLSLDFETRVETPAERYVGDTWRDPVCRRSFVLSAGGFFVASLAVSVYTPAYALVINIGVKQGYPITPIKIVIQQIGALETIATGVSDEVGCCSFLKPFKAGEYLVTAYRVAGSKMESSRKRVYIGSENHLIELSDFPQSSCDLEKIEAILFSKDSSRITQAADRVITNVKTAKFGVKCLYILEGRTCDLEFSMFSSRTNYDLSFDRCKAVVSRMTPTISSDSIIMAPMEDRYLQESSDKTIIDRKGLRSVQILVLKHELAAEL